MTALRGWKQRESEGLQYAVITQSANEEWWPIDSVGERLAACYEGSLSRVFCIPVQSRPRSAATRHSAHLRLRNPQPVQRPLRRGAALARRSFGLALPRLRCAAGRCAKRPGFARQNFGPPSLARPKNPSDARWNWHHRARAAENSRQLQSPQRRSSRVSSRTSNNSGAVITPCCSRPGSKACPSRWSKPCSAAAPASRPTSAATPN